MESIKDPLPDDYFNDFDQTRLANAQSILRKVYMSGDNSPEAQAGIAQLEQDMPDLEKQANVEIKRFGSRRVQRKAV